MVDLNIPVGVSDFEKLSKILTAEQEKTLRQPIEEYVGKIQKEIDELRKDGTAKTFPAFFFRYLRHIQNFFRIF